MLLTVLRRRPRSVSFMVKRSVSNTTPSSKPLQLPRLPVPPLRDTLDRYLKSLEPFLLEDEARGGASFRESMDTRQAWAKEFELGLGQTLQERLMVRLQSKSVIRKSTRLTHIYCKQSSIKLLHTTGLMITSGLRRRILNGARLCRSIQTGGWPIRMTRLCLWKSLMQKKGTTTVGDIILADSSRCLVVEPNTGVQGSLGVVSSLTVCPIICV